MPTRILLILLGGRLRRRKYNGHKGRLRRHTTCPANAGKDHKEHKAKKTGYILIKFYSLRVGEIRTRRLPTAIWVFDNKSASKSGKSYRILNLFFVHLVPARMTFSRAGFFVMSAQRTFVTLPSVNPRRSRASLLSNKCCIISF